MRVLRFRRSPLPDGEDNKTTRHSIQHRHRGDLTPHGPAHLTNRRPPFPSSTCVCDYGDLPAHRPDEEDNDIAAITSDSVPSSTSRRSGNFHGRSVCACLLARLLRRDAPRFPCPGLFVGLALGRARCAMITHAVAPRGGSLSYITRMPPRLAVRSALFSVDGGVWVFSWLNKIGRPF